VIINNKIYFFLISIVLFFSTCNNSHSINFSINGLWEGEDNNKLLKINFDNTNCKITFINQELFTSYTISGKYNLNFSKLPATIDVTNIKEINTSLFAIIKILNNNSIKISQFSDRWKTRPISFDNNSIVLIKKIK